MLVLLICLGSSSGSDNLFDLVYRFYQFTWTRLLVLRICLGSSAGSVNLFGLVCWVLLSAIFTIMKLTVKSLMGSRCVVSAFSSATSSPDIVVYRSVYCSG